MYKNVPSHQSVFRTMNLPQSTAPKKPPPQFSRSKPRDPRWPSPAWGPWPPVVPPIWRASRFWSSPSGIADKKGRFFTRKKQGVTKSLGIFVLQVLDFSFGFLSRYHLPCICNSLELEPDILHGICYILAWSLCILHVFFYIWPRLPSILHGICHILAFQPLICMVFDTFWCFKRSCGSLEGSLGFHLRFHLTFH